MFILIIHSNREFLEILFLRLFLPKAISAKMSTRISRKYCKLLNAQIFLIKVLNAYFINLFQATCANCMLCNRREQTKYKLLIIRYFSFQRDSIYVLDPSWCIFNSFQSTNFQLLTFILRNWAELIITSFQFYLIALSAICN